MSTLPKQFDKLISIYRPHFLSVKPEQKPKTQENTTSPYALLRAYLTLIKSELKSLEKHNYHYILLYHGDKTWWHAGDHSAFFLADQLSRLDLVKPDNDYFEKFTKKISLSPKSPFITTKNLELQTEEHATATLPDPFLNEHERYLRPLIEQKRAFPVFASNSVIILKLTTPYNKSTLDTLQKSNQLEKNKLREMLAPKYNLPETRRALEALYRFSETRFCSLRPEQRENTLNKEARAKITNLAFGFIQMSNGHQPQKAYFRASEQSLAFLKDWLTFIEHAEVFPIPDLIDFVYKISDISSRLKRDQKLLARHQAEQAEQTEQAEQAETPDLPLFQLLNAPGTHE